MESFENTIDKLIELAPENITVHTLSIKRAARLNHSGDREVLKNPADKMVEYATKRLLESGYLPYYLYRQKNIAGNFENVGYAKVDKAGIYNILIMEEKQSIVAAGAGASTKVVLPYEIPAPGSKNGRMTNLIRIENVRDVGEYISRIDEMIERKGEWLWH